MSPSASLNTAGEIFKSRVMGAPPTAKVWLAIGLAKTGDRLIVTVKVVETIPPFPSFAVTVMVETPPLTGETVSVLPDMFAVALLIKLEIAV